MQNSPLAQICRTRRYRWKSRHYHEIKPHSAGFLKIHIGYAEGGGARGGKSPGGRLGEDPG